MKITRNLIHNMKFLYMEYDIIALLIIISLYNDKVINREKLKALFKSHREGKLLRRVNTHHCNINDKWYNDEDTYTIFTEIWDNSKKSDIDFKELISLLNLYHNKTINYCIDWFFYQVIEPVINKYKQSGSYGFFDEYTSNRCMDIFKSFDISINAKSYDEWNRGNHYSGYCCEDCDGCYNQYKYNQYCSYITHNSIAGIREDFSKVLNSFKNKDYLRNETFKANNYIL